MNDRRRFWISWYQPGDDFRPVVWPLPPAIPAYWCSGYAAQGATLCAVVDAPGKRAAERAICKAWAVSNVEWRFCSEKPRDWRPGDRFPWPEENADAR